MDAQQQQSVIDGLLHQAEAWHTLYKRLCELGMNDERLQATTGLGRALEFVELLSARAAKYVQEAAE